MKMARAARLKPFHKNIHINFGNRKAKGKVFMKLDELKWGALLSYVTIFLNIITGLLYTPFMLRQLGQSEYGLYMLIGSLVGYISILDFGLHDTIYRFIAKYQADRDEKGQENFLATVFIIYGVITALILIAGMVLYFNLGKIFGASLTSEELLKANTMFAILIFNLAITLPLGAFQFIIRGYGKFVYANSVVIVRIIFRTIIVLAFLAVGFKSITIVVVDTAFNIVVGIAYLTFCFVKLKVKFKLHVFNKNVVNEIFSYSIYVFILAMVNQFFWKLGQVSLGIVVGTVAVAIYALAINIVIYYQQFSLGISGVFMPKISQMVAEGATNENLTDLMIRVGRVQLFILGLVLAGFIVLGKPFVLLWAGPDYHEAFLVALVIFIPLTIPMIQTIASVIIQVKDMQSFKAKTYLIMSGFNIVFSIILGRIYGAIGVGVSTAISIIVFQIVVMNLFYKFSLGLNIGRFFSKVFSNTLLVIIITIAFGFATKLIPGKGWGLFLIQAVLISCFYTGLMINFGFNKDEKEAYILPLINKIKDKLVLIKTVPK